MDRETTRNVSNAVFAELMTGLTLAGHDPGCIVTTATCAVVVVLVKRLDHACAVCILRE